MHLHALSTGTETSSKSEAKSIQHPHQFWKSSGERKLLKLHTGMRGQMSSWLMAYVALHAAGIKLLCLASSSLHEA